MGMMYVMDLFDVEKYTLHNYGLYFFYLKSKHDVLQECIRVTRTKVRCVTFLCSIMFTYALQVPNLIWKHTSMDYYSDFEE